MESPRAYSPAQCRAAILAAMIREPLVHVLIINWNGLEHLDACFRSLLDGARRNVRFVLVDNASTDGSVAYVREHFGEDARVEFLECPANLGWSGGNNAGIERALAAGADYLFLLNNDTATAPGALDCLVDMAEAHPEIGALAPKMVLFDYPDVINSVGLECSIIGAAWDKGAGRLDAPKWNRREKVIGVCGGAMFLRAEALRKTGLLPAEFEIYLDDLDLCLRVWNAGYEIWSCPEAVVRHKFSATFGQGSRAQRKYYLNTRNRFRVVLRNFPLGQAVRIKLRSIEGECRAMGRALIDGEAWRVWAHLKAWGASAAYLPRAWAERSRRRAKGIHHCRFWSMIRQDVLFCPGVELPWQGWYRERPVQGKLLRPMGRHAWIDTPGGRLRVIYGNCYPHLGSMDVRLSVNGSTVAQVNTAAIEQIDIEVPPGRLEFTATGFFDAELTGEIIDIGGWIAVEPLEGQTLS